LHTASEIQHLHSERAAPTISAPQHAPTKGTPHLFAQQRPFDFLLFLRFPGRIGQQGPDCIRNAILSTIDCLKNGGVLFARDHLRQIITNQKHVEGKQKMSFYVHTNSVDR